MGLCQRKRVKHAAASSGTVHLLVPTEFPSDDGEVQTELEERGVCGGAFDAVYYADESGRTVPLLPVLKKKQLQAARRIYEKK